MQCTRRFGSSTAQGGDGGGDRRKAGTAADAQETHTRSCGASNLYITHGHSFFWLVSRPKGRSYRCGYTIYRRCRRPSTCIVINGKASSTLYADTAASKASGLAQTIDWAGLGRARIADTAANHIGVSRFGLYAWTDMRPRSQGLFTSINDQRRPDEGCRRSCLRRSHRALAPDS